MGKQASVLPPSAVPVPRPPVKGDWQMVKMDVTMQEGHLVFAVVAAPVESVFFHGGCELHINLDESQAAAFVIPFPTTRPVSMDEFLNKLKGMRMAIEERVKKIVTVDG